MITVRINFYDKKTDHFVEQKKMDFPDEMVLAIAEKTDEIEGHTEFSTYAAEGHTIAYINARPFNVTDEMRAYATEQFPELKNKFDQYDYSFIGRHKLKPD